MNAFIISFLSLFGLMSQSTPKNTVDYCGFWLTENQKVIVEIYELKGILYGKIHESKDSSNENIKIGQVILKNLRYNKKLDRFTDGVLVSGTSSAKCEVQLNNSTELLVLIKKGPIKTNKTWTKINY